MPIKKAMQHRPSVPRPAEEGALAAAVSLPAYREVERPEELADPDAVARNLHATDWAFTEDDTSYLAHDVHPYPAKFIPQIPGHLIARLSLRGEVVFDPFGGSGTTALEAVRLGRRAISVDANPVGLLAGRVKTSHLSRAAQCDIHAIRSSLLAQLEQLPDDSSALVREFADYVPNIPNRSKWFPDTSCGELAFIRSAICRLDTESARDVALLAMSRIVVRVSFQDSETRYASKPRELPRGETIRLFLKALEAVVRDAGETASDIRYGVAEFIEADTRNLDAQISNESVDLVVTSPPYGNANDYHLYHRFRLFWLGADPRKFGRIEVGSHLRHQRESTGYEHYREEMRQCFVHIARALRPGRYAAIVIGDSVYRARTFRGCETIALIGREVGLAEITTIRRPIHRTKRSFVAPGQRAITESIVILRKPPRRCMVSLFSPPYTLWDYEVALRHRETESLAHAVPRPGREALQVDVDCMVAPHLKRVAFSHQLQANGGTAEPTWQAILENGLARSESAKKDPKYVTHGLHTYKGKFYPQLAKALINITGTRPGARILDPFCGSGTTLLESYLNGMSASGCDLNPLAAKIARAKVGVLDLDPVLVTDAAETLLEKLKSAPVRLPAGMDQFHVTARDEIRRWFPDRVVHKLNWLLRCVRSVSAATLRDFFEVVVSSIIREVSDQEPTDLRVRRRKAPIEDADVLGLFQSSLDTQVRRLERFWSIRGYCPHRFFKAHVDYADSRQWHSFRQIGVDESSVDLVLTSPPYATALPYIDTDRLSLLVLFGLNAPARRPLEESLTGSREIKRSDRLRLEEELLTKAADRLPVGVTAFIRKLHDRMRRSDAGFRRQNMPALLLRFFDDMRHVFANVQRAMKPGSRAMVVMGDNVTSIGAETVRIPTTEFVASIGEGIGLRLGETMPITVTTENFVHIRHAIKQNVVLCFEKPQRSSDRR